MLYNYVKNQINFIPLIKIPYPNKLKQLVHRMSHGPTHFDVYPDTTSIDVIKKKIKQFINHVQHAPYSKLASDIDKMSFASYKLETKQGFINLSFLFNETESNYVNIIIKAVYTFCHLFPYNYHNLHIYICLDDNKRTINLPTSMLNKDVKSKINYLQSQSSGFSVSGICYFKSKTIILTKREEIIKLLFHELVHFIGLDDQLIKDKLYEPYTEWVAVLLTIAFESIYLSKALNLNVDEICHELLTIEVNYSLYLTANVFKFFDYDMDWCKNKMVSQYIVLRTILLTHINDVLNMSDEHFYFTKNNVKKLIDIINTNNLIENLKPLMALPMTSSISFLAIDLNWSQFKNYFNY
jgi:hypothetical protein